MSWRDAARPIIAAVLADTIGQSEQQIRKALRDAYPWLPRENHPYKTWCDEVRRQRGLKPKLGRSIEPVDSRQTGLFQDKK